MEIYYIIVGILIVLAIVDLIVGVSNDAINFLSSALGSKVFSFRTIMIVASLGVLFGAIFSSGMMEVARKGIFHPQMFTFHEIIIIFTAVMLTDIILLDTFNRLGLPTSTTVSIVFELLGAAVAVSIWKIYHSPDYQIGQLGQFINSSRALFIIGGILFSIVLAFTIAAIVQYIARLVFTFQYDVYRRNVAVSIFGGIAIAAISYFIVLKGLKGTPFYDDIKEYIHGHTRQIILYSFVVGTLISYVINKFFHYNVFKIIILLGTFSLALAFAGNDLVNFIGVPIAAFNSLQILIREGGNPHEMLMTALSGKVPTPTLFLILAGTIMVITLWTSKKAMKVAETALNLSAQGATDEKFESNLVARSIVRSAIGINKALEAVIPGKVRAWVDSRFQIPEKNKKSKKINKNAAEFDVVRASVNLVVAAILISIGTSYHLPLSTTYVTFMAAMGSSLADRAWGRESAVYRIAGVISVIAGWFVTAMVAFTVAGLFASILYLWGLWTAFVILGLAVILMYRNHLHFRKEKEEEQSEVLTITYVLTDDTRMLLEKTFDRLLVLLRELQDDYEKIFTGLAHYDIVPLRQANDEIVKFFKQANKLREQLYYLLQNIDENQMKIGTNYIKLINRIQDAIQSIHYISKAAKDYVDNNHRPLTKDQIEDLRLISEKFSEYIRLVQDAIESKDFDSLKKFYKTSSELDNIIDEAIMRQIQRVRNNEVDSKNSAFFMSVLNESRDLVDSFRRIIKVSIKLNKPIRKALESASQPGQQEHEAGEKAQ